MSFTFGENEECEIKPVLDDNATPEYMKSLPRIDVVVLSDKNDTAWLAGAKMLQDKYNKGSIEARFSSVPVGFFHTAIEAKIQSIEKVLDYFCLKSEHQKIYFLWRPYLPDPKDDHLLELAIASGIKLIVTHNTKDFKGVEAFGIRSITPQAILEEIL